MTDTNTPNINELADHAARNYVLRAVESSRAEDLTDYTEIPALTETQVTEAMADLAEGVDNVTVAFTVDRRLPVLREDGEIYYVRTQDMDLATIDAALVTLAAEYAWLTQHQTQRADEYASLLALRARLQPRAKN